MTTLGLQWLAHNETKRSNLAKEAEENRHNVTTEGETYRHNVATETETNRSNLAKELETNRANVAREQIQQGTLDEQIRSNMARESISKAELAETQRSNIVNEGIKLLDVKEKERSNMAKEKETASHNDQTERLEAIKNLPQGSAQVAALGNYLKQYGGKIDSSTKSKIDKYLNAATLAAAGTAAYKKSMDSAMQLALKALIGGK